jgi:hypothetical protein
MHMLTAADQTRPTEVMALYGQSPMVYVHDRPVYHSLKHGKTARAAQLSIGARHFHCSNAGKYAPTDP